MREFIYKILQAINLTPKMWMDGGMCLAGNWIIDLMLWGGTIVFLLYQGFAIGCWLLYKSKIFTKIFPKKFFGNLAIVFHLCGTIHLSHSWAKIEAIWYSVSLVYFVLIPIMIYQVVLVVKSAKRVTNIRSAEEVEREQIELTDILLENIIHNTHESAVSLEKTRQELIQRGFEDRALQIDNILNEIKK